MFFVCAGFVMDSHLNRHTFGFIQSRLVPFYLHLGSACAFFNLTIYAVYHPRDMLDERESFQVGHCHPYKEQIIHWIFILFFIFSLRFASPIDLHLLCLCDGRSYQRSVVWPNDV